MTEMEALKAQIESLHTVLKNTTFEKMAIDQLCMKNIQENVQLRTTLLSREDKIRNLEEELKRFKETESHVVELHPISDENPIELANCPL